MFCPQCGQQQVAGVIRFCSRCGFPLDGVLQLFSNGGSLPVYRSPEEPVPISPRRKGVKQGGLLLLSGAVIVPILGIFASYSNSAFLEILAALAAIICFIGGPLRMLFAGVFEEGAPKPVACMDQRRCTCRNSLLNTCPALHCRLRLRARSPLLGARVPTAELVSPPSVTIRPACSKRKIAPSTSSAGISACRFR